MVGGDDAHLNSSYSGGLRVQISARRLVILVAFSGAVVELRKRLLALSSMSVRVDLLLDVFS
jgi:hypothetical protein